MEAIPRVQHFRVLEHILAALRHDVKKSSAGVMSVHDDDIIIFQRRTILCPPTAHALEDLTLRQEPASSSRPAQAEATTVACIASIIDSDPQMCTSSITPISVSFNALRDDRTPLKGCVLWNLRSCTVRKPREARKRNGEDGCGQVKSNTLSVIQKRLNEDVLF